MSVGTGARRIGDFARRVGVSPELLRAWERRYGLLRPVRSSGGFRLYTDDDAERVARMRRALDEGLSAAEAARLALTPEPGSTGLLKNAAARLLEYISRYDEGSVHAVLDEASGAFGVQATVGEVILPALRELGRNWDKEELGISHEHFASNLFHGRLLSLARLWEAAGGRSALLACPPGEEHDLSLLAFGVLLHSRGWRILFLGADTPIATIADTAAATAPALTVVSGFDPALLEREAAALRRLGKDHPLALGGPGATEALSRRVRARLLGEDLVSAAGVVARGGSSA